MKPCKLPDPGKHLFAAPRLNPSPIIGFGALQILVKEYSVEWGGLRRPSQQDLA